MSLLRVLAVTIVITRLLAAEPARPCSCSSSGHYRWLTATGDAPLEMRGPVLDGLQTSDPEAVVRALASVRVERYECDGAIAVPATAEVFDEHAILIVPTQPMLPGQTWRFWIERVGAPDWATSIVVTVRDVSLRAMTEKPVLRIGDASWGPLTVSAGASCSTSIPATQRTVTFELPAAYRGIEGSLLYFTQVNGDDWRPTSSLCRPVSRGRSWTAVGTELLYGVCNREEHPIRIFGDGGLDSDIHAVTMRAVLPGTSIAFTLDARADMRCQKTTAP